MDRKTNVSANFGQFNQQLLLKRNTTRQTKKYDNLARKKPVATPLNPDRTVINLLGESINDSTKTVLTKGLNFAPTPCSIPYQDFIGGIEPAIRKLPKEAAEEIRSQVTHFLKKAVPPKPNLSKEEKEALKELKTRKDIAILPADKGNATVLMTLKNYHEKIHTMLSDPAYRKIPRDPTESIKRKKIFQNLCCRHKFRERSVLFG
ncbi:hypothetical protein J437_LFUL007639 [Ladona fulva]|uniref:Uncharacterized protein n=1 Tax=Ladona fulva TaxID=123851 RepID=A0A8K0K819_LADFU|nr:hypothetical protein J437_LFUL007639 [Ladona fulva]